MSLGQNPTNNELSKAIQRLGIWTTPAFSAGDFTASGSMTWTVEAADVATYEYMIIGKTMWVSFAINTSSVGGTPNTSLLIKVPSGKTIKSAYLASHLSLCIDNNVATTGRVIAETGQTVLAVVRQDVANWTASTNLTYVYGQIFFEIQ